LKLAHSIKNKIPLTGSDVSEVK